MELMHNQAFRLLQDSPTGGYADGIYRVIFTEKVLGKVVTVKIDGEKASSKNVGGRMKLLAPKRRRKKSPPPLIGELMWMDEHELDRMHDAKLLHAVDVEREPVFYKKLESEVDKRYYDQRVCAMSGFLDLDLLKESILVHHGIGGLVREAMARAQVSRSFVYKQWSTLCRLGFSEISLRPRLDRCGASGVHRPCDPGGREKAGRKTAKQRVERDQGIKLAPDQPGMSAEWRAQIMAADRSIKTKVKPSMQKRYTLILESGFVKKYGSKNGKMTPIDPAMGTYPNFQQTKRILEIDVPRLQRLRDSTTSGHYKRSLRGLTARNWKGISGPGHTWAIDSTMADMYLRSSVNRAWIVGRPILYIIVDVWSTAVVGFYVCLTGPCWSTAKLSLFDAVATPELYGDVWGLEAIQSLYPRPTLCNELMCDRGEYLSKAASITALKLIPLMEYAPPYRPDLKGLVEVLHRIAKDAQFLFYPGAMDHRRKEFDLRKSNPAECIWTVREYTHFLHVLFSEYNLTADRSHRVDAHMAAAGVFPSPAGLWRWGHAMGIGTKRSVKEADLITTLLESDTARVGKSSVIYAGNDYQSKVIQAEDWTAYARNFGSQNIPINYHPGSVSRIWTPNTNGLGLLDLQISDQARASSELTFDEWMESIVFGQMQRANVGHERAMLRLQSNRLKDKIKHDAQRLTDEAVARSHGIQPSMTEARIMEVASMAGLSGGASEIRTTEKLRDEAMDAHHEMMKSIVDFADDEVADHA